MQLVWCSHTHIAICVRSYRICNSSTAANKAYYVTPKSDILIISGNISKSISTLRKCVTAVYLKAALLFMYHVPTFTLYNMREILQNMAKEFIRKIEIVPIQIVDDVEYVQSNLGLKFWDTLYVCTYSYF